MHGGRALVAYLLKPYSPAACQSVFSLDRMDDYAVTILVPSAAR